MAELYLVSPAASVALVNQTINLADPTSTGDVISTPLRLAGDASNAIAGYWCRWTMTDTVLANLRNAVRTAGWSPKPTAGEQTTYLPTDVIPAWPTQRIYSFDATVWTDSRVLTALGLAVPLVDR